MFWIFLRIQLLLLFVDTIFRGIEDGVLDSVFRGIEDGFFGQCFTWN